MADISAEITAFKNASYGEDVREALVSLAMKLNSVVTSLDDPWMHITKLVAGDDLNNCVRGLYWYVSSSVPNNAPYSTNSVVFCFGNATSSDNYQYQLALSKNSSEYISLRTRTPGYSENAFTEWSRLARYTKDLDSQITQLLSSIEISKSFNPANDNLTSYETSVHNKNYMFELPGLSFLDNDGNIGYNLADFAKSNYQNGTTHPGLSISDEDGNIVGEIANGKVNTLAGKTISFIGDSITTFSEWIPQGYATYYPKDYLKDVRETWWYQLIEQTGMRLIRNCSWSGSKVTGDSASTTSAAAASSDKRIADVAGPNNEIPDFIVILISVNDFNGGKPLGDWSYNKPVPENTTTTNITDAYMLMLSKLHIAYPTSHIFCCTICPHLRSTSQDPIYPTIHESSGVIETELNQRIRDIARAMNCEVIDFATSGLTVWNQSIYMGDGKLHPNTLGADIMTNIARSALERYNEKIYIESGV